MGRRIVLRKQPFPSRSAPDSFTISLLRPRLPRLPSPAFSRISQPHSSHFDPALATSLHVDAAGSTDMYANTHTRPTVYVCAPANVALVFARASPNGEKVKVKRWRRVRGERERESGVKGSRADTGLAPDCIYSSTKRFTFTKSFQLHGARRISTLLSSFRDVILLLAIVGEMQAGTVTSLSFSLSRSLSLSVSSFPSPPDDFKVVAENRFANPWRKRIEPLRSPALRSHFVLLLLGSVSFCLSLSIMGFRCSLANYEHLVGCLNSWQRCCIIARIQSARREVARANLRRERSITSLVPSNRIIAGSKYTRYNIRDFSADNRRN